MNVGVLVVGAGPAGLSAAPLRQKLEKKKSELAVREQEVSGRRQEKWIALKALVRSKEGFIVRRVDYASVVQQLDD